MKKRNNILIMTSCLILIMTVAVLAATVIYSKTKEVVKYEDVFGSNDNLGINITYMNMEEDFDSSFSIECSKDGIKNKSKRDVRVTTGFCDTSELDNYLLSIGYETNTKFLEENGYVSLYYQYKDKKYYLLQNIVSEPYCWNLVICNNGNYKFIKLSDIVINNNSTYPDLSFSKKVEFIDGKVRFYLNNGIYSLDLNDNVSYNKLNLNEVFFNITKKFDYEIFASRIEFCNGSFYVVCRDKENIYYLVRYEKSTKKISKYKLSYNAQDITCINNVISIVSFTKNNIYIESLDEISNTIIADKISHDDNIKMPNFEEDFFSNALVYDDKLNFALLSDKDVNIFSVDIHNSKLFNYQKCKMRKKNFIVYGLYLYTK